MNDRKPEVGQECEVLDKSKNKWNKVKVTAVGEDYLLAKWSSVAETILSKGCVFRPIQTKADKYREKQIEKMGKIVLPYKNFNYVTQGRHLYDAGCRMTRPLTDEVIEKLWTDSRYYTGGIGRFHDFAKAIAAYVTGEDL